MRIPRSGCSNLGKEGIVGGDQNGSSHVVRGVVEGVGMGNRKNGKGREGGGTIVGHSGEGIGLAVGCTTPVRDFVVVGSQSGSPS